MNHRWSHLLQLATFLLGLALGIAPARATAGAPMNVTTGADDMLQVITYNAGLSQVVGADIVPCVEGRVIAQLETLPKILKAPFVLNLQEVSSKELKEQYRAWAATHGYYVSGLSDSDADTDGESGGDHDLLTISSEPILLSRFKAFDSREFWSPFGYLETEINLNGKKLRLINTHTASSGVDGVKAHHVNQLRELARLSRAENSSLPVVFAGDLNIGSDLQVSTRKYDPSRALWQKEWLANLDPNWQEVGAGTGVTWDEQQNVLIRRPSPQLVAFTQTMVKLGATAWKFFDQRDQWGLSNSTLDHVYASLELEPVGSRILLNQPVNVPGCHDYQVLDSRAQPTGLGYLSDHYALEVSIRLKALPRIATAAAMCESADASACGATY